MKETIYIYNFFGKISYRYSSLSLCTYPEFTWHLCLNDQCDIGKKKQELYYEKKKKEEKTLGDVYIVVYILNCTVHTTKWCVILS